MWVGVKLNADNSNRYYRANEFSKAVQDAEEAIRLKPDWEKGYIRKALALSKMGTKISKEQILAVYEEGALKVPHSTQLARATVGLREELFLLREKQENASLERSIGEGRVTWNENELARHHAERGIMYARMKIDHPDTPFLVYDEEMTENRNMIGTISNKDAEPEFVDIDELQAKLGLLEVEQNCAEAFDEKRQEHYKNEAKAFLDEEASKN